MNGCIFCAIATGRQPSAKVLETDRVLAFLDIAPVHPGHTLVIPKAHFANFLDLPDDLWQEMGRASRRVAEALYKVFRAPGFNLGMNNFEAAGQVVMHAHLHVIPRYYGDGLELFPQGSYGPGVMEDFARKLRQAVEG